MKIVHIITSLNIGGAEKLLADSIPFYYENNVYPDIVTLKKSNSYLEKEIKNDYNSNLMHLSKGSVYNPFIIFKLIPILKRYQIAHVHLFPAIYWVIIAKVISFSKIKIIFTEHSTFNRRRNYLLLKYIDRFFYYFINEIVTISNEVDLELRKHLKSKKNNYTIIKNGINLVKFQSAIPYNKVDFFKDESIIITQVSSFRYPKDQKTLIKALSLLDDKFKLLLVGEGYLKKEAEEMCTNLNLNNRVKFLGLRNDVPNILKTSDIIILSSIYEGLSLSNLEGMCLNKPFIGANVPGIREIVSGYGLLFEKGNFEELSLIIKNLIDNPYLYNSIAKSCQERASEFNIDKMVKSYINLYKNAK